MFCSQCRLTRIAEPYPSNRPLPYLRAIPLQHLHRADIESRQCCQYVFPAPRRFYTPSLQFPFVVSHEPLPKVSLLSRLSGSAASTVLRSLLRTDALVPSPSMYHTDNLQTDMHPAQQKVRQESPAIAVRQSPQ